MLISKFNKLIRNKILWTILAVIIAFFFVGTSVMSRSGCGRTDEQRTAEGRLFGEEVSGNDFYIARFFEMGMRPMTDNSDEARAALRERTWQRLAALRMADEMGIVVTDDDVRALITRDPSFTSNGTFDQQRYLAFLQNQLRLDASTFEDYLRQDITLRRLMATLRTATWTSPYELSSRLARLTDRVGMTYAMMPDAPDTEAVDVTEEDIRTYFETYRDAFRIDEQRKVRYISFPVSEQLATARVAEDDITSYYNNHLADYTSVDTNGTETVQALDTLREPITEIVRRQQARFEAKDAATRFVMALTPDRYGQASTLDKAAQTQNRTVMTSDWFTVSETIPGLDDAGVEAAEAAFDLVPGDPERYFSDAIVGTNAAYVIADQDSRPARDPELSEVHDQVAAAATLKAQDEALAARIETIRGELMDAVTDTNRTFVTAAKDLGLATSTTGVFTVYEGLPEEAPYSTELITEMIDAEQGDVLPATETPDGMVIAYVSTRTPGDPSAAELLRPQFIQSLDQYRAAALYSDWLDQVMEKKGFEDYRPITE